ncbi:DNA helicase [Salvia divinorum]|uniref:DNA helicase n=1 Tax=Salvia divinorum TaxID=28513 RepID=A0ABD1FPJ9_SALDI
MDSTSLKPIKGECMDIDLKIRTQNCRLSSGKPIQSIAFLAFLYEENISSYLVIAPLSTLRNWEHELSTWNLLFGQADGPV